MHRRNALRQSSPSSCGSQEDRFGISREEQDNTHRTGLSYMKVESNYQYDDDISILSRDLLKIHQNSQRSGR